MYLGLAEKSTRLHERLLYVKLCKPTIYSNVAGQNYIWGPNFAEQAPKVRASFAKAPEAQTNLLGDVPVGRGGMSGRNKKFFHS